ncbi:coiled-coil domain-containing protein 191-like [Labeo rohita]|uniref:Coiled-coil domain-containing protein 191-like n=1 Tax=Labeo rohita TaxID=84645 RepID=A0A498NSF6_LABRO|nr:coiled-coil domain-containing protein 191-like [Labeo rohita]
MAALINAAASGKLVAEKSPPFTNPPETLSLTETISHQDVASAPDSSSTTAQTTISIGHSEAPPTQAWQVTRRHAALSAAELRQARQGQQQQTSRSGNAEHSGGQFKHRHAALQQTVAEQRRLLKEQQEQIRHLQERQNILELKHEEEKIALLATAMEERARQRAERRREIEERRRQKQEEKLRELEKQKRAEWEQELSKQATQHYLRTLLLHRGLAPWKNLLEQSHVNTQLYKQLSMFDFNTDQLKDLRFILEARAERFHRTRTQRKVFMALLDHTTEERITAWDNEQRAEEHNSRKAVKKCFAGWRRLPVVLREEKEREARREQLRRKVAEILPDFRSSPVGSLWRSVNPL